MLMLEVRRLSVSYGAVSAVRGIDLDVGTGEAVALLGPNGAGKTSTLRAICGLAGSRGSIRFDGKSIDRMSADAVARLGLILVPEGRHVFPSLTVAENLQVGMSARSGRRAEFGIDDVYELFPALKQIRRRIGKALSGGEQQMLAVGRGLVAAPRCLLLDEPSLGLSPLVSEAVFSGLQTISTRVGMLVVEQNTSAALTLCGRGYVLVAGHIVLSGSRDELADREEMMAAYLQGGSLHETSGPK
jgi:branched-chain amino acid transport system ATP-binding protein